MLQLMIDGHQCVGCYAFFFFLINTKNKIIPKVVKLVTSFEVAETEGKKTSCFKLSVTSIIEGIRV